MDWIDLASKIKTAVPLIVGNTSAAWVARIHDALAAIKPSTNIYLAEFTDIGRYLQIMVVIHRSRKSCQRNVTENQVDRNSSVGNYGKQNNMELVESTIEWKKLRTKIAGWGSNVFELPPDRKAGRPSVFFFFFCLSIFME